MCFDDTIDFLTRLLLLQRLSRDPKTNRHDLHSNDAHLSIRIARFILSVQFSEEVDVRVESDADAVDEENRESRFRGMWSMPVG